MVSFSSLSTASVHCYEVSCSLIVQDLSTHNIQRLNLDATPGNASTSILEPVAEGTGHLRVMNSRSHAAMNAVQQG